MANYSLGRLAEDTVHVLVGALVLGGALTVVTVAGWAVLYGVGALVVWASLLIGSDPSVGGLTLNAGYFKIGFFFAILCGAFAPPAGLLLIIMKYLGADITRGIKEKFGANYFS